MPKEDSAAPETSSIGVISAKGSASSGKSNHNYIQIQYDR